MSNPTLEIDAYPTLITEPGKPARIIVPRLELDTWGAEKYMCRLIDCIERAREHDGDPL